MTTYSEGRKGSDSSFFYLLVLKKSYFAGFIKTFSHFYRKQRLSYFNAYDHPGLSLVLPNIF